MMLLALSFAACKQDSKTNPVDSENTPSNYTRNQPDPALIKQHRTSWRKAYRGGDEGASLDVLKKAEEELRASDFAFLVEKIEAVADGGESGGLVRQLARLVGKRGGRKLPGWYFQLEDAELREGIAFAVGGEMARTDRQKKDTVLAWFDVKKEQVRFMLGFGIGSIPSGPNKAFDNYLAWGVKNGALEAFPELILKLPKETDFKACDAKIPRSTAHIAVACRKAIYKRWAEVNVVQLIDYLVSLEKYDDDLRSALLEWGKQNEKGLEDWMLQVEASGKENPAWVTVRRIRVEKIMEKDLEKAWNMTRDIRDEGTREPLLRKVHAIWIKKDFKAADAARKHHVRVTPKKAQDGIPGN